MPVENESVQSHPGQHILKIGLAVVRDGCLLTVRKFDGEHLILPGGKLEQGETDQEALRREISEELGCELVWGSLRWLGVFEDEAADAPLSRVTVRLYGGEIAGMPRANREIADLKWFDPAHDDREQLAPSLRNQIVDRLLPSQGHTSENAAS